LYGGAVKSAALRHLPRYATTYVIHEEYIIINKESFWPKEYFDLTRRSSSPLIVAQYQRHIGVREPRESWGYDSDFNPKSDDKVTNSGLCYVKAHFTEGTRINYIDVTNLIKTKFVNPFYHNGRIASSYRVFDSVTGFCNI
jgi:hypothetical protein